MSLLETFILYHMISAILIPFYNEHALHLQLEKIKVCFCICFCICICFSSILNMEETHILNKNSY